MSTYPNTLMRRLLRATLALALVLGLAACGGGGGADPSVSLSAVSDSGHAHALAVSNPVATSSVSVVGLTKVSETRVGRTTYDYVFRVSLQNNGADQTNVLASLTSVGAGTTIIDGSVALAAIAAGQTLPASDTVTLRQDRLFAFVPSALVWSVSSTAAGPVPAALSLRPAQRVIGAGDSLSMTVTVSDANGSPITPAPAIAFEVLPYPQGTAGTLPSVSGLALNTATDTRGSFTVRGTIVGTALTSSFSVAVIQNAGQSANSGQYVTLGTSVAQLDDKLAALRAALAAGDAVGAAAANAAIVAAGNAVELPRLAFSTPYSPDTGFVPSHDKLVTAGFAAGAGDGAYASATTQLRNKLVQISTLLQQPGPDTAANTALLTQYQGELQTIANSLQSASVTVSPLGINDQGVPITTLLSTELPGLVKSIASRVNAEVQGQGQIGPRMQTLAVAGAGPRMQPNQFAFGSMLNALGPIGQMIYKIYGDYLDQIERTVALLAAKGLLDAFIDQTVTMDGVHAGAAVLGPYAYNYFGSYIEVAGMSLADAQAADVFLIGGNAVAALTNLGKPLKPPKKPTSVREVTDWLNGIIDALKAANQAYELAHQQPSSVFYDSFENGGCYATFNDSCLEMYYPSGFKNVSGGNVSFTVLMLIRLGGPRPQTGSGVFNFAPGT